VLGLSDDDRAVVFHFDTGRAVEIDVTAGPDGQIAELTIAGPQGERRARRVEPPGVVDDTDR